MQQSVKKVSSDAEFTSVNAVSTLPFRCVIKGYQLFISPLLGQSCRFHPSCSCYAQQALSEHGLIKGTWLATRRILKCNPMHPGGFDYVPTAQHKNKPLK